MNCIDCINFKSGPMNAYGFGACALQRVYESFPMQHTCERFKPVTAAIAAKRAAFFAMRGVA